MANIMPFAAILRRYCSVPNDLLRRLLRGQAVRLVSLRKTCLRFHSHDFN